MPPKKKGKGKKSGKKSGGKKKKGKKSGVVKEVKLTAEEAILQFQIEVKERSIEDMLYELRVLKDKNERLKERNKRLKQEQLAHIKNMLKLSKEKDKEVENVVEVNREQVEQALVSKFDLRKYEAKEVEEKEQELKFMDEKIEDVRFEIRKRQEYRDYGKNEHAKQIVLMKQDLKEMDDNHADIAAHLERSLRISKEEISCYTESTLAKQKDIASEVSVHQEGHEELIGVVEDLEKRNLDIMSELFDCKIEDLKYTRKFYLACIEDQENSESEEELGEETLAINGVVSEQVEKPEDLFENYYLPGEADFEDSPRLGPMELQLLSLVGTPKPIHRFDESDESGSLTRPENYGDPKRWPISNQMLSSIVSQ